MDELIILAIGGVVAVSSYIGDLTKSIFTPTDEKYKEIIERLDNIENKIKEDK